MRIDFEELLFSGRGSSALWAILKSLNKSNGKVLLPVNICEIVYPVILRARMTPVFYDVNPNDGNARLKNIQEAYSGEASVLLAVHNYGAPLDIDEIAKWAKENNIFLIEDVCNAIGATYKEKSLGTFGDAAFFSFGYAKIVEYGVGGAALINNEDLKLKVKDHISSLEEYSENHKKKDAEYQGRLREIRQQAHAQLSSVYLPLYNEYSEYLLYKIDRKTEDEIKKLINKIDRNIEERAQKAIRYRNAIKTGKVKHIDEVPGQIYWRYNLLVAPDVRDDLIMELRNNNILVSTWFPPIAELFEEGINMDLYPGSRVFSRQVINLFVDQRASYADISKTVEIINRM